MKLTSSKSFEGVVTHPSARSSSPHYYWVDVYLNGRSSEPTQIEVRQMQIAKEGSIPEGTWTIVLENVFMETVASQPVYEYSMQVPVYL